MAGDILGIGTSGLLASQRNLATTSHNISNVNTAGYSRQRTEQEARMPQYTGNGYVGSGVSVQTTVRLANEFLEKQVRNSNSQLGQYEAYNRLASQVDNIIANPDTGLTPSLENFYSALQEANDNPSSTPSRQVLLTEANTLTDRFALLDTRFNEINDQANQDLIDFTAEVNDAARSIARINADITLRIGAGQGDMPNDLIDQREVLIKNISENINVSVVYQDDGSANLFIGSGQPLVIGTHSLTLATQTGEFSVSDLDVVLIENGSSSIITSMVKGGELQGVLDFKAEILDPARHSLGRIAIAITEEMNSQHKLGMTLQDTGAGFKPGDNFFNDLSGPVSALGAADNVGEMEFNITDSRVLTISDYELDYVGVDAYTLTRLSDGKVFPPTAPGTLAALNSSIDGGSAADPQGFTIAPVSAPAAGDSFLIRPALHAASDISVEVNNVLDIALAAPLTAGAMTNPDGSGGAVNAGTGEISLPLEYKLESGKTLPLISTTDPDGALTMLPPSALSPVSLTFTANTFTVNNLGAATIDYLDLGTDTWVYGAVSPIPYDPQTDSGTTFIVNYPTGAGFVDSLAFQMQGIPEDFDSFEIGRNETPFNDNRNGLLMSKLQTTKTLENGSTDFQAGYSMIVSDVGTKARSSSIDLLAQQTLNEQAKAVRESYSGVNLDEEAADLLKFQQAYQASARVISSADQMFQTLINAV